MADRRHRVYNFAVDSLDLKQLLKNLDVVFGSLRCAAKLNVAFSVVLKNVEDGSCKYYYAHGNNTLWERPKLVATLEDLTKIKKLQSNTDATESCTRKRAIKKWKWYCLTKVTVSAALLKEAPMGCKDCIVRSADEKTFRQMFSP